MSEENDSFPRYFNDPLKDRRLDALDEIIAQTVRSPLFSGQPRYVAPMRSSERSSACTRASRIFASPFMTASPMAIGRPAAER